MIKVAIVTGGTGSIGSAVCTCLLAQGWTVVAADIAEPGELPKNLHFAKLDVTSTASINAVFDVAAALGNVQALVNAHGILLETTVGSYDEERFQAVLDINLKGVARMCDAAVSRIADRGAIVQLSSVTAMMGRAKGSSAYVASKAGVEALTRNFAVALASREVRVNCVAPGFVSQPMAGEGSMLRARQGGNDAVQSFTPFGRLVTPREVAEVICFLCSERASGVSGVVIPVDGGQLAF
jgi:NAD(P)-dependent dehydrogenase (short-subunit alcohol dehydrogenase family)